MNDLGSDIVLEMTMCCSRKYPYPSSGSFFYFEPPLPPIHTHTPMWKFQFSFKHPLKNWTFKSPLPSLDWAWIISGTAQWGGTVLNLQFLKIKMISTEHSRNNGNN